MPPSTAALTIGSAAVSSRTHGRSLSFPKLIMPRQTLDTLRPVRPRFVYLIATSSLSSTRRPYRRGSHPEFARIRRLRLWRFLPAVVGHAARDAREGGVYETFRPRRVRARRSHSGRPSRRG